MREWRFIRDVPSQGVYNMAADYALLASCIRGESVPVVRMYAWDTPTVTIGYFQDPVRELHLDYCQKNSVPYIRRITGGGTVLHAAEITYSIVVPVGYSPELYSIEHSYRMLCEPVISALKESGVDAVFRPINDITVNGKKISGSAQTRRRDVIMQHGTIIVDVRPELFFNVLNIDKKKCTEVLSEQNLPITTLFSCLGNSARSEQFLDSWIEKYITAFSCVFSAVCKPSHLTDREKDDVEKAEQLFSDPLWNSARKNIKEYFEI